MTCRGRWEWVENLGVKEIGTGGKRLQDIFLWLSQQRILTEPGHGGGFLFGDNGYSDQSGRCIRPDCRCIHGLRVPVLPPPASHAIARGWLAAAGACCHAVTTAAAAAVAAAAQRLPPRARLFISFKRSHLLHAAVASANPSMWSACCGAPAAPQEAASSRLSFNESASTLFLHAFGDAASASRPRGPAPPLARSHCCRRARLSLHEVAAAAHKRVGNLCRVEIKAVAPLWTEGFSRESTRQGRLRSTQAHSVRTSGQCESGKAVGTNEVAAWRRQAVRIGR